MTGKAKIVAWVSIVGAGLGAGLVTAVNFFPNLTTILTSLGGLVGAVVVLIVTKNKE